MKGTWMIQKHFRSDDLENVLMIVKVSKWFAKCPDDLTSVWVIWKVSGWSSKCLNDMVMESSVKCALLCKNTISPNISCDSFFHCIGFAIETAILRTFVKNLKISQFISQVPQATCSRYMSVGKFFTLKFCRPESFRFYWLWVLRK